MAPAVARREQGTTDPALKVAAGDKRVDANAPEVDTGEGHGQISDHSQITVDSVASPSPPLPDAAARLKAWLDTYYVRGSFDDRTLARPLPQGKAMRTETARLKDGRSVKFIPDPIGEGTMKEVFFTADRSSVVCFYKDPNAGNDPVRMRRLEAILGRFNPTVRRDDGGAAANALEADYFKKLFCWPTGIATAPRFGFITPAYPANFFFASGPDFIRGREKNGMRFIGPKNRRLLEEHAPDVLGDWQGYLAVCIRMARAVARLHMTGLAHSDLSPNNVLVDPKTWASCVIDIDSLVVPGVFPPDVLGTKGYIAPEVLKTIHLPTDNPGRKHPDVRTDQHALAVLVYQYLLRRHPLEGRRIPPARTAEEQDLLSYGSQALFCEHPQDADNRPEESQYVPCTSLGSYLKELFYRAFTKGLHLPDERPAATEWQGGLIKTWDLLRPCDNGRVLPSGSSSPILDASCARSARLHRRSAHPSSSSAGKSARIAWYPSAIWLFTTICKSSNGTRSTSDCPVPIRIRPRRHTAYSTRDAGY